MHLCFIIRMSGSWLTMSFILLYTNEVDGKSIMSSSTTIKTTSEETPDNFNAFPTYNGGNRMNHHSYSQKQNNQNNNNNYNYDGEKVMNFDDIQDNSDVTNSNLNNDYDHDSMRRRRRRRRERNRQVSSKISSNYLRDHIYPSGRKGRPVPDYSQGGREEGENGDMLSDFQTSSLRSNIDKIPEPIRTRFFDTTLMKDSFKSTDFENGSGPIATPLVQQDYARSENEHTRRHPKSHSRKNKEKRKELLSNFLPRNEMRKQYCLKKIMRKIWKLNCKQYINLKRLNLINNNKMDLTDIEIKRRLKKCLALFRIS